MKSIVLNKLQKLFLICSFALLLISCNNLNNSSSQENPNNSQKVQITMAVDGMTCQGCENTVQNALTAIDGIDSASASHVHKIVDIFVDTSQVSIKEIRNAINSKGYRAGVIYE